MSKMNQGRVGTWKALEHCLLMSQSTKLEPIATRVPVFIISVQPSKTAVYIMPRQRASVPSDKGIRFIASNIRQMPSPALHSPGPVDVAAPARWCLGTGLRRNRILLERLPSPRHADRSAGKHIPPPGEIFGRRVGMLSNGWRMEDMGPNRSEPSSPGVIA